MLSSTFIINVCNKCFDAEKLASFFFYIKDFLDENDDLFINDSKLSTTENKLLELLIGNYKNKPENKKVTSDVVIDLYPHEIPTVSLLINYKKILYDNACSLLIPKIKIKYIKSNFSFNGLSSHRLKYLSYDRDEEEKNDVFDINNFFTTQVSSKWITWGKVFKLIKYKNKRMLFYNPTMLFVDVSHVCVCSFDNSDVYLS